MLLSLADCRRCALHLRTVVLQREYVLFLIEHGEHGATFYCQRRSSLRYLLWAVQLPAKPSRHKILALEVSIHEYLICRFIFKYFGSRASRWALLLKHLYTLQAAWYSDLLFTVCRRRCLQQLAPVCFNVPAPRAQEQPSWNENRSHLAPTLRLRCHRFLPLSRPYSHCFSKSTAFL